MTRKHFRALATIIQENIRSEGYSDYRIHYNRFINDLCTFLRRENPRFDVAKFIEACTPPDGKEIPKNEAQSIVEEWKSQHSNEAVTILKALINGLPEEYDDLHTKNLIEKAQSFIAKNA